MRKSIFTCLLLAGSALTGQQAFAAENKYVYCNSTYGGNTETCSWVTGDSLYTLPEGAVRFDKGTENGANVYVCRDKGNVPGKYVNGACYVPWYGKEYKKTGSDFSILTMNPSYVKWEQVNTRVDLESNVLHPGKALVKSAMDSGYPSYVCGVKDAHGNFMTGKLVNGHCWYAAGGREYNYSMLTGHVYVLWYTGPN